MALKPKWDVFVGALEALSTCERYGARFVDRSGAATFYSYATVLKRASSAAATLKAKGLQPGDRVVLILPTCIEFLDAFLGTMLAGGIPAALYPPVRLGKLKEYYDRTRIMIDRIGARRLITNGQIKQILGTIAMETSSLDEVIDAESLQGASPVAFAPADPDSPAFLQFSSGTTSVPKAVIITHRVLLNNLAMIDQMFDGYSDEDAERGAVCWLPLYHDMGLLGNLLLGFYHPGTVTYLRPEQFIAKPSLWLQTMSRYRAAASAAPGFAYGYCTTRIRPDEMKGVDLSHWDLALNGAEAIDTTVMARFIDRFREWGFRPEAMMPVYGLAEAGLAVTFSSPHHPPVVTEFDRDRLAAEGRAVPGRGRRLASVGRPLTGLQVELHDPPGTLVPPGHVGSIMLKGPSITPGYFNDPEATRHALVDGWLDTGDLGFFYQGDLYISGRRKDLIIIRGRNCAPQEIEELLADTPGLRTGCAVALGYEVEAEGEQLIVLAECAPDTAREGADIIADIRERILAGIGIMPYRVELLKPGTLPRTSSGKMRRADALRMYLAGELVAPPRMGTARMAGELVKSQLGWARFMWRTRGKADPAPDEG